MGSGSPSIIKQSYSIAHFSNKIWDEEPQHLFIDRMMCFYGQIIETSCNRFHKLNNLLEWFLEEDRKRVVYKRCEAIKEKFFCFCIIQIRFHLKTLLFHKSAVISKIEVEAEKFAYLQKEDLIREYHRKPSKSVIDKGFV